MGFLGASLAYAWAQVNLWTGRANQAWGSSRQWNSGTSFESAYGTAQANYNAEVAAYNGMVGERDTWQGRANQAWGASRVWNSGASFESQVARALSKWQGNSVNTQIVFGSWTTINWGGPTSDPLGMGSGASLTVQRTGQYTIMFAVGGPGFANESYQLRVLIAGGVVLTEQFADAGGGGMARIYYAAQLTAGQTIQVQGMHNQATRTVVARACEVTFVPTPANAS